MSSSEDFDDPQPSTSTQKPKRSYTKCTLPLEKSRRAIASSLAKVVTNMVYKELQDKCKELLQMDDIAETEARILYVLQQIDEEREEQEQFKAANRRRRAKK